MTDPNNDPRMSEYGLDELCTPQEATIEHVSPLSPPASLSTDFLLVSYLSTGYSATDAPHGRNMGFSGHCSSSQKTSRTLESSPSDMTLTSRSSISRMRSPRERLKRTQRTYARDLLDYGLRQNP